MSQINVGHFLSVVIFHNCHHHCVRCYGGKDKALGLHHFLIAQHTHLLHTRSLDMGRIWLPLQGTHFTSRNSNEEKEFRKAEPFKLLCVANSFSAEQPRQTLRQIAHTTPLIRNDHSLNKILKKDKKWRETPALPFEDQDRTSCFISILFFSKMCFAAFLSFKQLCVCVACQYIR